MSGEGIWTHRFYKKYLKFTAVVIGSFGPIFALSTMEDYSAPARLTLQLLSGGTEQSFEAPTTRFLSALTGGFLLGWGVTVWMLSADAVYDAAPEGVRKVVLTGLVSWCCLDSAGSIASGTPVNAAWNLAVLALGAGP